MALVQRTINQCDVCGYEWIPRSNGERCGNRECRSTKWNGVAERLIAHRKVTISSEGSNPSAISTNTIEHLKDICAGNVEFNPPLNPCPKIGFNETDGERYQCRLAKGHKGNCQPGDRVD